MSWTRMHMVAAIVLLAVAATGQAGLKVIYYDDFSGAAKDPLNGTTPDISADRSTWQAGQYVHADGSYGDGTAGHMWTATLPWTPVSGTMYELEAKVDNQGDWFGIGFLATTITVNYETRLLDNQPRLWCLVRQTGASNFDQAFMGPGTTGPLGDATVRSSSKLRVRIDTTKAPWVVTWFFDDVQTFQRTLDPSTFTIGYIAMGANGLFSGATGKISLFRLVEVSTFGEATDPSPADQATDVYRDTALSWKPGEFAASHDVYLGSSFNDVNSAGSNSSLGVLVTKGHNATTFDPGRLEFGKTYYWRVDEVNAAPSTAVFKGSVWSFTVEPRAYPIDNVTATASDSGAGSGPENMVNGSGLDANDLHSTAPTAMWLTGQSPTPPVWVQFEFDKIYELYQMWIWNHNSEFEATLGFGLKDVTIQYSIDGTGWTDLKSLELAQAPGMDNYAHNTTVDFDGAAAQYVRIDVASNWGGVQYGLSEVRFFYIPVQARSPQPASGSLDVPVDAVLSWMPGREAASHEVYISTDQQAVADGTALAGTLTDRSFTPSLNVGQTYYWKVNEVNNAAAVKTWEGDVWTFIASSYVPIDDMESYDDTDKRVFDTWIDGFLTPATNGALVGYDTAANGTFGETTIVHSGGQSMPLRYTNTGSITNSEATRTFDPIQDWTQNGVNALTLYFYGRATNTTTIPLWVKLTDQNGKIAKVTFGSAAGEDPTALADPAWTEWNMPLSGFSGVSLTNIKAMTIGLGSGAGSGTLLIDDIRLRAFTPAAPVAPVLVGWWKLDNDVKDGSGNGNDGTITGAPTYVTGKIGSALALNGTADYVDCGTGASLDILDAVTLSAWIKPMTFGSSTYQTLVGKGDHAYCLHHTNGNVIEFYIYNSGWRNINGGAVPSTFNGAWHHLAGTYDGTQLKLYIDGKLVASSLWAGSVDTTTYSVSIGRNSEMTGRLFNGSIDDVRIYRGALPTSEIVKLANP
jgi:hypothetical protein